MCGITGIIDCNREVLRPALLNLMRDTLLNRGPDGEGSFLEGSVGMAMRRLSVIDIEGGTQPFFSRDRSVVAFQNGEIYNHLSLREQLETAGYVFSSHSDTEVLAHGYAQWGIAGLLERLDGMFALAVLDRQDRQLHLARDRFGEKPLFYAAAEGTFAYSSDLLSLAALPWVRDELSPESLNSYLALHYVPGSETILTCVKRVLPGERLMVQIDRPQPRTTRYYSLPLRSNDTASLEQVADLVQSSVRSRLIADVPVGIFLSGGLDSSVIAAVAAAQVSRISTFSIGFDSKAHDEGPFAELVAHAIGSDHHHFQFSEDSFLELLPKVAEALDEPVGDQALLPVYWLSREARQHVTVVLSGEGADEIFGGYSYYEPYVSTPGMSSLNALAAHFGFGSGSDVSRLVDPAASVTPSGFPFVSDWNWRKAVMDWDLNLSLHQLDWEVCLVQWLNRSRNRLQRATAADVATWLPDDLLVKLDRMTMAHSLEGRAPYLNHHLVETALGLPETERMTVNAPALPAAKVALRKVATRWLPQSIVDRKKQGFVLPMEKWLQQWFSQRGGIAAYFSTVDVPWLKSAEVASRIQSEHDAGMMNPRLTFAVILLAEWYRSFVDRRRHLRRSYQAAINS